MVKAFFTTAGIIVAVDQLLKWLIRYTVPLDGFLPFVGKSVGLSHIANTGSAFGLLQGMNALLIVVSIVVVIALIGWHKKLAAWKGSDVLTGLLLGGIVGNLIDRIAWGAVIDFIRIGPWPAFNIADAALTLGVIALIYEQWRREK